MNSSRLILIFLGIIFIVIIILSSNRIAPNLKKRLGGIFSKPAVTQTQVQESQDQAMPTPTVDAAEISGTPAVSPTLSKIPSETPATGISDIFWIIIIGSLILGYWTSNKSAKLLK